MAATQSPQPDFSILVTCYQDADTLEIFHRTLTEAMATVDHSYEIVYVNDGSDDRTWEIMQELFASGTHVGIAIDLMCNTGQTNAQTAAIAHARGKNLIFIDSDLQVDPAETPLLIAEFDKGVDLVSGRRMKRQDPMMRLIFSRMANVLLRGATDRRLEDIGSGFKVLRGDLVRAFGFGQFKVFRPVSVLAATGRCVEIPITHRPRENGRSRWAFRQLFGFYRNIFVETSQRFFPMATAVALALGALNSLLIVAMFLFPDSMYRVFGTSWFSLMPSIQFMAIVVLIGLVGEITLKNARTLQGDPVFIIRTLLERDLNG